MSGVPPPNLGVPFINSWHLFTDRAPTGAHPPTSPSLIDGRAAMFMEEKCGNLKGKIRGPCWGEPWKLLERVHDEKAIIMSLSQLREQAGMRRNTS